MTFNRTDLVSGLIIMVVGLLVSLQALHYGLGTVRTIGPGLFPFISGTALALLGVALTISALISRSGETAPPITIRWSAAASVFAGLTAWAVVTPAFGLLPGTVALILLASLASGRLRPGLIIGLIVVLCGGGYLLFVQALGLPLPMLKI